MPIRCSIVCMAKSTGMQRSARQLLGTGRAVVAAGAGTTRRSATSSSTSRPYYNYILVSESTQRTYNGITNDLERCALDGPCDSVPGLHWKFGAGHGHRYSSSLSSQAVSYLAHAPHAADCVSTEGRPQAAQSPPALPRTGEPAACLLWGWGCCCSRHRHNGQGGRPTPTAARHVGSQGHAQRALS